MILSVIAFAFLITDSTDRLQKVVSFIPPKYSAYLPVLYGVFFVGALLLLSSAHKDDMEALKQAPDVAALHEANTRLTNQVAQLLASVANRRLAPSVADILSRALASGLENYWKLLPGNVERKRFKVTLISIGRERETLDYRADFEKAFVAGGFDVATSEWEAGPPLLEPFTGTLTLLPTAKLKWSSIKPPNVEMRGIVAAALQLAGLEFRTAPFPSISRYDSEGHIAVEGVVAASFSMFIVQNAAHLVIGQRG